MAWPAVEVLTRYRSVCWSPAEVSPRAYRLGDATGGEAGASLRELMNRMGHSSMRAALIYQHRTAQRDKMIAAAISERVSAELTDIDCPSGT